MFDFPRVGTCKRKSLFDNFGEKTFILTLIFIHYSMLPIQVFECVYMWLRSGLFLRGRIRSKTDRIRNLQPTAPMKSHRVEGNLIGTEAPGTE